MPNSSETAGETREGQRIAKVMARAGLCSRRDAEQWIADGRVSVNGEVLTSPAFNVSEADNVVVDGTPLKAPERTRLFLFHKPRGLVTTAKDPEGRATIFDALPEDLPRVVAVGRLDINSEGLLLLTNDGGLSRILELPSTGWLRRYRVRAHGEITQEQLDGLRDGVTIDGVDYLGIEARFERQQGSNVWLTMGLREGKNREIKRVLEHMGLSVNRLIRVSFGPFELADLEERAVVEVRTRVLRDQLGPKLAKAAGANFDAPVEEPALPPPPPPERVSSHDRTPRRPRESSQAPDRPPPRESTPQRKRKHVSVLRAEAREEAAGPRKRIARATTADRKGREVKVERVSVVRPPETRERATRRENAGESRGERRYGEGSRPPRRGAGHDERGERRPRDESRAPRRERSAEGFGDRRPRDSTLPRKSGGEGSGERSYRGATRPGGAKTSDERRPRSPSRSPRTGDDPRPRRERDAEGFRERRPHDEAPRRERSAASFRERGPREEAPRREHSARTGDRGEGRPNSRRESENFSQRPERKGSRPPSRGGPSAPQRPSAEREGGRPARSGPARGASPKRPHGGGGSRPGGGKGQRPPRGK